MYFEWNIIHLKYGNKAQIRILKFKFLRQP